MRIFFLIGLAVLAVFLAGYGGVLSIEKNVDASLDGAEGANQGAVSKVNESEHAECLQKDSESEDHSAFREKGSDGTVTLGRVVFYTSLESGAERAKRSGKPVFLYLHSWSCGWCKKFEDEVLTEPGVVSMLESSFVPVAVEVDEQREIAQRFMVYGTPTMVFLDSDGEELTRNRGFVDAEGFRRILVGIMG